MPTKKQAMEHYKNDNMPEKALHAIVIFWGINKFFFPLNRGGYNRFVEATKIQSTEVKTLYFRLKVFHTLKRVMEVRNQ